jgi:regulator of protease activity HflC (stomatin/prohibitin superfamily)
MTTREIVIKDTHRGLWYEDGVRLAAHAEAEARRIKNEADGENLKRAQDAAALYEAHPSLLRVRELEAIAELAKNANARIYIGFPKHSAGDEKGD